MSDLGLSLSAIPTLETSRLRLRPHRREDFPACLALWADPTVTRYIGGRPFSREEVWARFLRYAGGWHWLGFGYWAVEEISTGQFIGELGYSQNERSFDPPLTLLDAAGLSMVLWNLGPEQFSNAPVACCSRYGRCNSSTRMTRERSCCRRCFFRWPLLRW